MAEQITLTNLANLTNQSTAVTTINNNNAAITTAFEDVLSRSGVSPNQMQSVLDMNSNRIINLPSPISITEPVTVGYFNNYITTGQGTSGLTGVPVSPAMQPVVNAATIPAAAALLGISISSAMQPVVNASTIPAAATLLGISSAMQPVVNASTIAAAQALLGISSGAGANNITAAYTIQTSDAGKNIYASGVGSSGVPYTITLPSAAGFPNNFAVFVHNNDTTRGKMLSGFPADFAAGGKVLWPNQFGGVVNNGGTWVTTINPGIWVADSSVTFQVNHASGSDTAGVTDGLGTGSGAFATIYHAWTVVQSMVRVPTNANINIQNANETFTETPSAAFLGPAGAGSNGVVFITGNNSSPSSCVWNTAGLHFDDGAVVSLNGFTVHSTGSGQTLLSVEKMGLLVFTNMIFGDATGGAHFQIFQGGSLVYDGGSYTVTGNCNYHLFNNGGYAAINASVSIPNSLVFTAWAGGQNSGSHSDFTNSSFSGTGAGSGSTGSQFAIIQNATLNLGGVTLPGGSAGTTGTGGRQY